MQVLKGLGYGLDEVAVESVREWTFSPATRDGVPVPVVAQIDVEFNLRSANAQRISAGMTPPKVLSRVEPQYTEEARRAKIPDVKVVLQVVVKTDGSVDVVRVVQGFAFGMTDSVIHAVEQWKFSPGQRNGQDVDVALNVECTFQLY
jgi:TonB family protein